MTELMQNLLKLQSLEFAAKQGESAEATIAELRGRIPPQVLGHYDRLRVRGKKGLVPVVNQVCTGCHMRLPLAVIMVLKHDEDIQLCDTCGRYLFLPDVTASEPEDKPIEPKAVRSPRKRKKAVSAGEAVRLGGAVSVSSAAQARINL